MYPLTTKGWGGELAGVRALVDLVSAVTGAFEEY